MTIAVGETRTLEVGRITRTRLALYAGASGDHNPMHIDLDVARSAGRDDVFAHGMLMMAHLGRVVTDWFPPERVRSFSARFVAITPVNADPVVHGEVVDVADGIARVELRAELADGTITVRGEAVVDLAAG